MANGSYVNGKFVASKSNIVWKNVRVANSLFDLVVSMQQRTSVTMRVGTSDVLVTGIVNGIELEDGSGYSYNVTLMSKEIVYVLFK